MEKQRRIYIVGAITLLFVIILVLGMSYGFWKIGFEQNEYNVSNSTCLKIQFEEKSPEISLLETYPMSDQEGKKLEPFVFSVRNTCSDPASYQVNLENMIHEYKELPLEYVKVELNEHEPSKLTSHTKVSPSAEEMKEAYKLMSGTLRGEEEVTYELRIWVDEETPASEETSEASFVSKVSVIALPTTE